MNGAKTNCGAFIELVNYSNLGAQLWRTAPQTCATCGAGTAAAVATADAGQWTSAYATWPGCATGTPASFVVTAAAGGTVVNAPGNHTPAFHHPAALGAALIPTPDVATFRASGAGLSRWRVVLRDNPGGSAPVVDVAQLGVPGNPSAALAGLNVPLPAGCTVPAPSPLGVGTTSATCSLARSGPALWHATDGMQEVSVSAPGGSPVSVLAHWCSPSSDGRMRCTLHYTT